MITGVLLTSLKISPTDTWHPPNFATRLSECLPFPEPGAPRTNITLLVEANERENEHAIPRVIERALTENIILE